ncbi:MAG: PSD1 domain-containing protein [Verrucomicrobiales bacterium]|nr:PSD1 domain-containing protein [Verrucomicrobiales bacterium]
MAASPSRRAWPTPFLFACLTGLAGISLSGTAAEAPQPVIFSRDVLPILSDNCFHCHGPDAKEGRKGDLRLDDETDAKRDRDGYRVVAAGDATASELIRRLLTDDPDEKMPPPKTGRHLTPAQTDILTRWIAEGAKWGRHWAFERVERPSVADESRHPVDALVARQLAGSGIQANPSADRTTLIRRLTLDLTGLPPTPEQVSAFLSDEKPGAWERLVDRTLDSPAFGERMAWDWLDAARYADSNGYQGDNERTMWPWRDWVVRAFNDNLPYDQFTLWQLAGDRLPGATPDQILATGFNRNHMINGEGGRIAEENRVDYVMDMTETFGTVWLGLTLNCCRCHDHKFDPLTQRDYYQFTAFFNQTPVTGAGGNPQTPPVLEVSTPDQQKAIEAAEAPWKEILKEVNRMEWELFPRSGKDPVSKSPVAASLPEELRKSLDLAAFSRKPEDWDRLSAHFKASHPAYAELIGRAKPAKQRLESARAEIPKVMVMEDLKEPRKTHLLDRGLYNQPREEVPAAVPASLPPLPHGVKADRLGLANWLISREHPLTARVAVNRLWQMLFGIGLVKTAEDFGVQAEYPVQRELLDWLAAEYMESGWDTKALLRLILTSETYRRSSAIESPEVRERDPENRLLARGARFRMPSWMIRDQALAASGLLRPQIGGKPVFPYQPEGIWSEATFGKKEYRQDTGDALHRRSLYTFWRRIVGPTEIFDNAKRQVCEVKPLRTNTPMHALTTLNSTTHVEAARALAEKALQSPGDETARLNFAMRRVLGRDVRPEEAPVWHRSLERSRAAFRADPPAADRLLAHGASPRDGSLPAAEHAAWTAVCLNLLNLDETLTKE